jgi:hypothetical protein
MCSSPIIIFPNNAKVPGKRISGLVVVKAVLTGTKHLLGGWEYWNYGVAIFTN